MVFCSVPATQGLAALLAHSEINLAAGAGATIPSLTVPVTAGGAARAEMDTPSTNTSAETEGRHPRRRKSLRGGSGGVGSGGGSVGGGGSLTPRSRGRGGRGFRDVEGEAIAVAAKVAELIRKEDVVEALRVVRLVQVGQLCLGAVA